MTHHFDPGYTGMVAALYAPAIAVVSITAWVERTGE